jgi:predicted RNA-binding Zn-ribbon protein involved in translation (DUF1610 family)
MSYYVKDETKIEGYFVWYSLISGGRVQIPHRYDNKVDAQLEADRLPEGKVSPRYGLKKVHTEYPCPKCGHEGGIIAEYRQHMDSITKYKCTNPDCEHEWEYT